jgi:hypothetical protein
MDDLQLGQRVLAGFQQADRRLNSAQFKEMLDGIADSQERQRQREFFLALRQRVYERRTQLENELLQNILARLEQHKDQLLAGTQQLEADLEGMGTVSKVMQGVEAFLKVVETAVGWV